MRQEEKDLLLKDLCTRLPYGVKAEIKYHDGTWELLAIYKNGTTYVARDIGYPIETLFEDCKPYLFPLSSMTKKQIEKLKRLCDMYTPDDDYHPYGYWGIEVLYKHIDSSDNYKFNFKTNVIDWFNKNHFDYRGLIPMGLAEDATGKNIY